MSGDAARARLSCPITRVYLSMTIWKWWGGVGRAAELDEPSEKEELVGEADTTRHDTRQDRAALDVGGDARRGGR